MIRYPVPQSSSTQSMSNVDAMPRFIEYQNVYPSVDVWVACVTSHYSLLTHQVSFPQGASYRGLSPAQLSYRKRIDPCLQCSHGRNLGPVWPSQLNCLIEGEFIVFLVMPVVERDCPVVGDLKEVVQRARALSILKNVDPHTLELWKVSTPCHSEAEVLGLAGCVFFGHALLFSNLICYIIT